MQRGWRVLEPKADVRIAKQSWFLVVM